MIGRHSPQIVSPCRLSLSSSSYIYTEASQADEREKVVQFINTLVLNAGPAASHTP